VQFERAVITNTVTRDQVSVMFNPDEYSLNRDINYSSTGIPGLSAPILQFVHGNAQTLDMELLVDTYEAHREGSRVLNRAWQDVREISGQLIRLMDIDPTTHAPPELLFTWASLSFECVLSKASQKFLLFAPDGTPVRVRLNVTFTEVRNADLEAREVKRQTADYSKLHVVAQGETLSSIAYATYQDAGLWRPIALANGIDDPAAMEVGTRLSIPRLPYQDALSGEMYPRTQP
jgi:nucleoid-associated protein YgaU